jgi:hypothetical protein
MFRWPRYAFHRSNERPRTLILPRFCGHTGKRQADLVVGSFQMPQYR